MPEDIRLLAADLDGTLLSPHGQLSPRTIAALRAAESAGWRLVFATGRRQSYAMQVLGKAGLRADAVLITSNGAVVRTLDGELIERNLLPVEQARQICRQLTEFRNVMVFTFDRVGSGALVVEQFSTLHRSIARWVEANADEIVAVTPMEQAFEDGDAPVQGMICGTLDRMAQAVAMLEADTHTARQLRAGISIHRTEYAARDLCIVDLLPVACSKGRALARLAAFYGIEPAQVLAIGDNMNDADMLAWSGHPVVMANAAAELRTIAEAEGWQLTASNEEDGAAQAIEAALAGRLKSLLRIVPVVN
ncbi:MAG TPA: HAD-IIB family hydrolase [Acidobacteriaceae bacterium]|jgi:hypothetical protein|nr:HAD-IIB family hydrolase [Acidobacteriaceae bacterium]